MKKIFWSVFPLCFIFLNSHCMIVADESGGGKNAPFSLIFISDIHCKASMSTCPNMNQLSQIIADIKDAENNVRGVCIAGDLTDDGNDQQYSVFRSVWLDPITQLMPDEPHGGLYLCKGNHDESSGKDTQLLNFLKHEYGDFRYSFDIENLHVICCGKYPDLSLFPNLNDCCGMPNTMKWLKSDLEDVGTNRPIAIFFHFNIMGNYSDWWGISCGSWQIQQPITVKNALFDLLKNYNVKCIFFGHYHHSFSCMWRNVIPVADVGGDEYALFRYDPISQNCDIVFKDGIGSESSWTDKMENHQKEL